MSTRAVRTAIALQKLDPNLPHCQTNKSGQLVPVTGVVPVSVIEEVIEVKSEVVEVTQPIVNVEESAVSPESTESKLVEEAVTIAAESTVEATEDKKPSKKKKSVSTDL